MAAATGPILVLDSGSPRVSVAIGRGGEMLAERSAEVARSSTALLRMIDEVLAEARLHPADLAGVAALAGPGSFTGLRIGLSTALGLHQALGIAATALPTHAALAAQVPADSEEVPADARVIAVVDVLRGEWAVQIFENGSSGPLEILSEPALADHARRGRTLVVGFGVRRLSELPEWRDESVDLIEPIGLAPAALRLLPGDLAAWDPAHLTSPIYGRPPAVTLPRAQLSTIADQTH